MDRARLLGMGNNPQISVAPSALADLARKSASYQLLFDTSNINQLVKQLEQKAATIQKAVALSPAMQTFVKAANTMQKQIAKAFKKVKKLFREYLLIPCQELQKIQPVIVEKIFYRLLLLPNAYRSHSPPFYCVIK